MEQELSNEEKRELLKKKVELATEEEVEDAESV